MTHVAYVVRLGLLLVFSFFGMFLLSALFLPDMINIAAEEGARAAFDYVASYRLFWLLVVATVGPFALAIFMFIMRRQIVKN